jgi:hypothetical protein
MSVLDGYREEDYNVQIEPGEHQLKIVNAEEKVFNSGNEGLKIELVNKDKIRFFYHIINNDYFNQNLTRFYDCFKIRRGDTDFNRWIGRFGWAFIDKGRPNDSGKSYMEIKRLAVKQPGAAPSPASNPLNEKRKQLIADINDLVNRSDADNLPYFTDREEREITYTINRCGPHEDGIRLLEKEKARITALLKERENVNEPAPGWEDAREAPPADDGFKDDIPF